MPAGREPALSEHTSMGWIDQTLTRAGEIPPWLREGKVFHSISAEATRCIEGVERGEGQDEGLGFALGQRRATLNDDGHHLVEARDAHIDMAFPADRLDQLDRAGEFQTFA